MSQELPGEPSKIKSFSGNAQGLSLRFEAPDAEEIPVSRAYVPQIKAAL